MPSTHKFSVHLIDTTDRLMKAGAKEPLAVLYEGNNFVAAQEAAQAATTNENRGKSIRFYNFQLIGGGMKDTPIT